MASTLSVDGAGPVNSIPAVCCNRLNARACPIKHERVDSLRACSAPSGSRSKSMGIHTYITNVLCGGVPFSARVRGGRGTREMSLKLGRLVDTAFARRVNDKVQSNVAEHCVRVKKIIAELARRGVHTCAAQVPVGMAHEGIAVRTELDGLGCLLDGEPVVIEIKTTTATKKDYLEGYRIPCSKRPRMASGNMNTLAERHMLQLGFGALCINTTKGVLVVSCADGALSFALTPAFCRKDLFGHTTDKAVAKAPEVQVRTMVAWPEHDVSLLAALSEVKGLAGVNRWHRTSAVPASARFVGAGPGEDVAVCVCTGSRWSKSKQRDAVEAGRATGAKHVCAVWQTTRRWKAVLLV